MVPASFAESNVVLSRPPGTTDDQCDPLSVMRTETADGQPVVVSCWKCTIEELAEINRTGRIWLTIWGHTMPPVMPTGTRPF